MSHISLLLIYLLISFLISFLLTPSFVRFLYHYKLGKQIRDEALLGKAEIFSKMHAHKIGTPTMGAAMILFTVFFCVLLSVVVQFLSPYLQDIFGFSIRYSLWNRQETYLPLFTLFTLGLVGIIDDYYNVRGIGRTKGLSARIKTAALIIFSLLGAYWFHVKLGYSSISFPAIGSIDIGWVYFPLFIALIFTMANSVNITDGLDGLAGGMLVMNYAVYAFICFHQGLQILTGLCLIIIGALISFLWFNIKPAKFYMGDVGSLSLGATLAILAIMTDTLVVLGIISLLFIFEAFTSFLQVASKKLRGGKKIFLVAPFHHHLEASGWLEETIVMRFWLIEMILSIAGLIAYFLLA